MQLSAVLDCSRSFGLVLLDSHEVYFLFLPQLPFVKHLSIDTILQLHES